MFIDLPDATSTKLLHHVVDVVGLSDPLVVPHKNATVSIIQGILSDGLVRQDMEPLDGHTLRLVVVPEVDHGLTVHEVVGANRTSMVGDEHLLAVFCVDLDRVFDAVFLWQVKPLG